MTPKQKQLLDYLKEFESDHGYCPTFQEMADAMGLKSKSGVHRLITALEECGEITRLKNRARQIFVGRSDLPKSNEAKAAVLSIGATLRMHQNKKISAWAALREIETHQKILADRIE